MKKIISTLLLLSLVLLASCTATGSCPYMKMKSKCDAGCAASCDKAKAMKDEAGKTSCGGAKCGQSDEKKSCH